MIQIAPHSDLSARYTVKETLSGEIFTLHFNWNERESYWYFDLYDSDDQTVLLAGVKLVPGYFLTRQYRATTGMPDGDFYYFDTQRNLASPDLSFEAFGDRYLLIYLTTEEIASGGF